MWLNSVLSGVTIEVEASMIFSLYEVEHWVLHCIVQCRELRPYPEELDNNCF